MIVAACAVATLLKTDYSAMGILTIVLMYNMRKNKMYCIGIGCAVLYAVESEMKSPVFWL